MAASAEDSQAADSHKLNRHGVYIGFLKVWSFSREISRVGIGKFSIPELRMARSPAQDWLVFCTGLQSDLVLVSGPKCVFFTGPF